MEKKPVKKLVLNKDVIKRLDKGQLGDVAGAEGPQTFQTIFCTAASVCPCPTKYP